MVSKSGKSSPLDLPPLAALARQERETWTTLAYAGNPEAAQAAFPAWDQAAGAFRREVNAFWLLALVSTLQGYRREIEAERDVYAKLASDPDTPQEVASHALSRATAIEFAIGRFDAAVTLPAEGE